MFLLSLLFCTRKRVDLQTSENACPFAQISIFHTAQEQIATNDLATSILFFFSLWVNKPFQCLGYGTCFNNASLKVTYRNVKNCNFPLYPLRTSSILYSALYDYCLGQYICLSLIYSQQKPFKKFTNRISRNRMNWTNKTRKSRYLTRSPLLKHKTPL